MAVTFDFTDLERAFEPTKQAPEVDTSTITSGLTSQLFNVLDQGLPNLTADSPTDTDCASSVCLKVFIHGLMFGLMFLAFILVMLVSILLWLSLRGCVKRRAAIQPRNRLPSRPISRPLSRQVLDDADDDDHLGPRPITPPRRKWGVQRYVARWATPQAASMNVALPNDIPMNVMKPSSSPQVLHSYFLTRYLWFYSNTPKKVLILN